MLPEPPEVFLKGFSHFRGFQPAMQPNHGRDGWSAAAIDIG